MKKHFIISLFIFFLSVNALSTQIQFQYYNPESEQIENIDCFTREEDIEILKLSGTIKDMIETLGDDEEDMIVPLPNIRQDVFLKIFELLKLLREYKIESKQHRKNIIYEDFAKAIADLENNLFYELILAANFLDIPQILEIAAEQHMSSEQLTSFKNYSQPFDESLGKILFDLSKESPFLNLFIARNPFKQTAISQKELLFGCQVAGACISHDGEKIGIFSASPRAFSLLDIITEKKLWEKNLNILRGDFKFSPNGQYIATSEISILNAQTGEAVFQLHRDGIQSTSINFCFSPDSKCIAIQRRNSLEIYNIETQLIEKTLETNLADNLAYTTDGNRIIYSPKPKDGTPHSNAIYIWNLITNDISEIQIPDKFSVIALAANRNTLVTVEQSGYTSKRISFYNLVKCQYIGSYTEPFPTEPFPHANFPLGTRLYECFLPNDLLAIVRCETTTLLLNTNTSEVINGFIKNDGTYSVPIATHFNHNNWKLTSLIYYAGSRNYSCNLWARTWSIIDNPTVSALKKNLTYEQKRFLELTELRMQEKKTLDLTNVRKQHLLKIFRKMHPSLRAQVINTSNFKVPVVDRAASKAYELRKPLENTFYGCAAFSLVAYFFYKLTTDSLASINQE